MKMIKVEDKVHEDAKSKAKELGMTLQGYIKMLVAKDKKWLLNIVVIALLMLELLCFQRIALLMMGYSLGVSSVLLMILEH